MRQTLILVLATPLLLCAADPVAPADEVQDLLFLGDDVPALIRLHLRVGGVPFRTAYRDGWRAYVEQLFRQLDHDGNGFLDEKEAAQLPPAQPMQPGNLGGLQTNVAFNFRVVDADGDGKLSIAEVQQYYADHVGAAFQAQAAPPLFGRPELGNALFAKLDKDRDGRLTHAELLAAAATLAPLDLDEDDQLTPEELAPQLAGVAQMAQALSGRQGRTRPAQSRPTFLPVAPGEDAALLAGRARVDAATLTKVLAGPPALELIVRLGPGAGETPLEVVNAADPGAVRRRPDGGLAVMVGKKLLEFRRNEGRPALAEGFRARMLHQFRAATTYSQGRLTPREAGQYNFFPLQFALLDRNGDGAVTEAELTAYLDQVVPPQVRAVTGAVVLTASGEGRGLYDLLDRDGDGKLSLQELTQAPQLLALLGHGADGALTAADLPRCYRVAVGLGGASLGQFGGQGVFTPRGMPLLTLDWSLPGLAWFHRMDRNHDGVVSRREFLGGRKAFEQLDADGDGLITLEEARRAATAPRP